jgi:hypothetical protein
MDYPEPIHTPTTTPSYGCLKNGTLPTYRQFYNRQTLKNHTGMGKHNSDYGDSNHLGKESSQKILLDTTNISNPLTDGDTQHDSTPLSNCKSEDTDNSSSDTETHRKLLKRTYKVGKSNTDRKISVLVSNKTIRHNASNKSITLKKTPINDVRRYLVKQGLVKVGTIAPPDVLRKMYESASMVCGDVTNHNSETLMYNFMNSTKKTW